MAFLDIAEPYIELGWHIFPMRAGTNGYFGKDEDAAWSYRQFGGGFYWGTTDRAKVAEWSRRWPGANIGLRTGEKSGVVVLDMDFGKPGSNTQEAVDLLAERGFRFPQPNVIARTPSGGTHWHYRYVGPIASSASKLGASLMGLDETGKPRKSNIDVRADGGLAVLPPTRVDGKGVYRWELPPWDDDGKPKRLVPLPRWVIDQLKNCNTPLLRSERRPYTPPARGSLHEIPDWRLQKVANTPPNTQRNETFFRQVAQAADWGHSEAEIRTKFTEAGLACGLELDEIRKALGQALQQKNRRDPRHRMGGF